MKKTFKTSSGDIFKDFGFSDEEAAALTIKSSLFRTLQFALRESSETQAELAERICAPQEKIADIINGKMAGLSVESLAKYLLKLDCETCVDAQPTSPNTSGC